MAHRGGAPIGWGAAAGRPGRALRSDESRSGQFGREAESAVDDGQAGQRKGMLVVGYALCNV